MKDKNSAAFLALFLGGLGAHKFYLGKGGEGLFYLLFCWTFIPVLLGVYHFFVLFFMPQHQFDYYYNNVAPYGGSQGVSQIVNVHLSNLLVGEASQPQGERVVDQLQKPNENEPAPRVNSSIVQT